MTEAPAVAMTETWRNTNDVVHLVYFRSARGVAMDHEMLCGVTYVTYGAWGPWFDVPTCIACLSASISSLYDRELRRKLPPIGTPW